MEIIITRQSFNILRHYTKKEYEEVGNIKRALYTVELKPSNVGA